MLQSFPAFVRVASAEDAPALEGRPIERRLALDEEGRVLDHHGRRLTTLELAQRIGDEDVVGRYRTRGFGGCNDPYAAPGLLVSYTPGAMC